MTGLLQDLQAVVDSRASKPCAVADWIAGRPTDEQAGIRGFAVSGLAWAQIWNVLRKHGFELSQSSLNNHLSGRCTCPKEETK